MDVSARRAFALLKELAYVRVSCSDDEKRAAERLCEVAKEAGVEAHIEAFPVECGKVHSAKLVVTEPYTKEYEITGYERSASTPEGGLDAEFYYAENASPVHLANCKGKIVMVNDYLRKPAYEAVVKAGAAGIITFSGSTMDRLSETDCDIRKLRPMLTEEVGFIPACHLRTMDAVEIVRRGAKKMHIEIESECYEGTSHNVCAVIEGTKYPDEIVSFGAHFDSVHFSTGVYDNMSGSVIIMEIMKYFAAHRPQRTMKFNWYGSEEQGLLGSKAWVAAHKDELEKHVLMVNVDVAAPILGTNAVPVLATPAAVGYIDSMMREAGIAADVKLDIYSSDCIPFADNGVPAVNFCRFGPQGAGFIHDRRDNLKNKYLSEAALDITLQQVLVFAKRIDSAVVFPIARELCDEIKGKVDKYLFKKPEKK